MAQGVRAWLSHQTPPTPKHTRACMSAQLCLTLRALMDCSPPGSSIHGILQARIPEWVAVSFSRGSSQPRDRTRVSCVSCIGRQILYHWATWESPNWATQSFLFFCFFNFLNWYAHKIHTLGLPRWLSVKESTCQAGDAGSTPGSGSSLEKEMATHSSIVWEIPWTEEPGGLQSMVLQRVGHDWACTHIMTLSFLIMWHWTTYLTTLFPFLHI